MEFTGGFKIGQMILSRSIEPVQGEGNVFITEKLLLGSSLWIFSLFIYASVIKKYSPSNPNPLTLST
jgi:hypothetical protein